MWHHSSGLCGDSFDKFELGICEYEDDWRKEVLDTHALRRALLIEKQEKQELSERLRIAISQVNDLRSRLDSTITYYKQRESEVESATNSERKIDNLISQASLFFGVKFSSYESLLDYLTSRRNEPIDESSSKRKATPACQIPTPKASTKWKPEDIIPNSVPRRLFYTLKRIVEDETLENTEKIQNLITSTCNFYTNNNDTTRALTVLERFIPELSSLVLGKTLILTEFGKDDSAAHTCLRKVGESLELLKETQKKFENLTMTAEMTNLKFLSLKAKYRKMKRHVRDWVNQLERAPMERNAEDHITVKVHKKKRGTANTPQHGTPAPQ